jgi:hypothetical protein
MSAHDALSVLDLGVEVFSFLSRFDGNEIPESRALLEKSKSLWPALLCVN